MCNHAAKLVILAAWWRLQDDGPSDLLIQIETSNSVRQDMATRGEIGDQNVGTGVFQYGECDCMRRRLKMKRIVVIFVYVRTSSFYLKTTQWDFHWL